MWWSHRETEIVIFFFRYCDVLYIWVGMDTETRYLISLVAKLWKTGVSISSDVNGSSIGTG